MRSGALTRLRHIAEVLTTLHPPTAPDEQDAYDQAAIICDATVAAAIAADTRRGCDWRHGRLLVGCVRDGAPPEQMNWELEYYRTRVNKPPHRTLAALHAWFQSPAGLERPISPTYAFRHEGTAEQETQAALGESWRLAGGAPADDCWWLALVCLAYVRCPDHTIWCHDPPSRASTIAISQAGLALVQEWHRYLVACGQAYSAPPHQPLALPALPQLAWAEEIRGALTIQSGE